VPLDDRAVRQREHSVMLVELRDALDVGGVQALEKQPARSSGSLACARAGSDFLLLNVAVPQIGRGVGLGLDQHVWVTTAYALPAAGFTLMFGRMADLFGRRRMFMGAMLLLTVASIV
jgi:MFS family permease